MPAQPLTPEQLADAGRLKMLFANWQLRRKASGQPYSQEFATDALGFNQSALSQYLNGRIPLNPAAAAKFASVLECSITDFSPALATQVAGFAAALPPDRPEPQVKSAARIQVGPEPNSIPIRRMNVSVRAGVAMLDREYDVTYGLDLHLPADVVADLKVNPDNLVAVKVEGASMEPLMFEDDLIVVDLGDKKLMNRELYLVNFDHQPCVKQMLNRGGQWYLHSINPDEEYGDRNARSAPFEVVGRVVYQPGRKLTGRV